MANFQGKYIRVGFLVLVLSILVANFTTTYHRYVTPHGTFIEKWKLADDNRLFGRSVGQGVGLGLYSNTIELSIIALIAFLILSLYFEFNVKRGCTLLLILSIVSLLSLSRGAIADTCLSGSYSDKNLGYYVSFGALDSVFNLPITRIETDLTSQRAAYDAALRSQGVSGGFLTRLCGTHRYAFFRIDLFAVWLLSLFLGMRVIREDDQGMRTTTNPTIQVDPS